MKRPAVNIGILILLVSVIAVSLWRIFEVRVDYYPCRKGAPIPPPGPCRPIFDVTVFRNVPFYSNRPNTGGHLD